MHQRSASPDLSFKALTDRLEAYEEPRSSPAPKIHYDGRPAGADANLWTRYQAERQATMEAKKSALADLRVKHLR